MRYRVIALCSAVLSLATACCVAAKAEDAKPDIEKKLKPQLTTEALESLQKNAKVVYDPTFFGMEKK